MNQADRRLNVAELTRTASISLESLTSSIDISVLDVLKFRCWRLLNSDESIFNFLVDLTKKEYEKNSSRVWHPIFNAGSARRKSTSLRWTPTDDCPWFQGHYRCGKLVTIRKPSSNLHSRKLQNRQVRSIFKVMMIISFKIRGIVYKNVIPYSQTFIRMYRVKFMGHLPDLASSDYLWFQRLG